MMRIDRLLGSVAALALCVSMTSGALAGGLKDGPSTSPKKWQPWVEGGCYLSTERHRGELDLFAPLWQSSVALMFFQASGKVFEDDIEEGNFALGFRQMQGSGWNLGFWTGYDVRNSEVDNTFHQLAFGFEALSHRWDLRANGYVALSDPEASPGLAQVALSGNGIFMTGGEEVPLSGFDGEIGYKLFGTRAGDGWGLKDGPAPYGRSHELRVFAGGYYFDDDDALEEVAGARARVEWRIDNVLAALPGSRLTFEGEYQYDDVRDDQWEGGVRLRVPFGRGSKAAYASHLASLTPQERRMTERIERDVDIVTTVSKAESVFDTLTGVAFDRAAVVQGGGDLQGALDANGANSLIVLDGGTTNGSAAVGPGQTLQGGASTIQVTGQRTGTTAGFTAPGSKPSIVQTLNQAVVTVDSNTHLAGLGIRGGGIGAGFANDGIVPTANGVSNVAITDTSIRDMGDSGIDFDNDHNKILISRTSVDGATTGIGFGLNNRDIALQTVNVSNVFFYGIAFAGGNSDLTLRDVTTNNTGLEGLFFGNDNNGIALANVVVDDTGALGNGISFIDRNSNVTMENVTVRNAINDGIWFADDNSNITLKNVTVDTIGNTGISFNDNNSNITVSNSTVANAGLNGIFFNNANSDITITETTVAHVAGAGIFVSTFNDTVTVSNSTISNASTTGIALNTSNNNITLSGNTISDAGTAGVFINSANSNVTVSDNAISNITFDGLLISGNNTNLLLSNNTFSGIGGDLFDFFGAGTTLAAGSTGNTASDAPGGLLCSGAGNFTGTLEVTDQNGALQTFVNGC